MAALWYVKAKGEKMNSLVVVKVITIIEKLTETKDMRMFKMGCEKAGEMLAKGEEKGSFHSFGV
jgi:hypothetical protein